MPMNSNDAGIRRLLGNLGLCARARALIFGTPMICEALRKPRKPYLVLEAGDTSPATHKRLADKCHTYEVRHIRLDGVSGAHLAQAVGKKSTLAAVAVTDEGLCRPVNAALDALTSEKEVQTATQPHNQPN